MINFTFESIPEFFKFTFDGIEIRINDEHPFNAFFPIDFKLYDKSNFLNEEHPSNAFLPIDFKYAGNESCSSDKQPAKANSQILVILEGILIFSKELQFSKQWDPKEETELGIFISFNFWQFLNKHSLNLMISQLKIACSNDEQSSKQFIPNDNDVEKILIFFNDEHPLKANDPIEFNDDGNKKESKDEHPKNALFPIDTILELIIISVKDLHPSNALISIITTDDGIFIVFKDVQFWNK